MPVIYVYMLKLYREVSMPFDRNETRWQYSENTGADQPRGLSNIIKIAFVQMGLRWHDPDSIFTINCYARDNADALPTSPRRIKCNTFENAMRTVHM